MNLNRIKTIFLKDARDAIRDGRVLIALLIPIGLAFFYNATVSDEPDQPTATVAHTENAALVETLEASTEGSVEATFEQAPAGEIEGMVESEEADVGIVLPDDFEGQLSGGGSPEVQVYLPETESVGGSYIATALDPTLRALAGQPAPAAVEVQTVSAEAASANPIVQLGFDTYLVLASVVFLIGMISMFAVPMILAEEREKKTLDALVMISSYGEVVAAKALVGLLYTGIAVTLLMGLIGLAPENIALFGAAVLTMSLALVGFGLLFGGFFRNANQLNTWGGFLLIPVVTPAFAAGLPLPGWGEAIVAATPTGQGMQLVINSMAGEAVFPNQGLAFLVIGLWCLAGFAALIFTLRRRQAMS